MRTFLALAFGVAISLSPATAQEGPMTVIFGVGGHSCATWIANGKSNGEVAVWIYGFWSGLNVANGTRHHAVGQYTDAAGVTAEVELTCTKTPSKTIAAATTETFNRLAGEGH